MWSLFSYFDSYSGLLPLISSTFAFNSSPSSTVSSNLICSFFFVICVSHFCWRFLYLKHFFFFHSFVRYVSCEAVHLYFNIIYPSHSYLYTSIMSTWFFYFPQQFSRFPSLFAPFFKSPILPTSSHLKIKHYLYSFTSHHK